MPRPRRHTPRTPPPLPAGLHEKNTALARQPTAWLTSSVKEISPQYGENGRKSAILGVRGRKIFQPGCWIRTQGRKIFQPGCRIRTQGRKIFQPGCRIPTQGRKIFQPGCRNHASAVLHSGVAVWWSACCLLWVWSPCDPSRKLFTSDSK
mgnify:CR=1 FL=1